MKVIKIKPINFNLKSNLEKESILNSYKNFLKACNFDIQILIQSKKEDLSNHFSKIKNNIEKEKNNILNNYYDNYYNFINKLNNEKNSSSKNILIIIKNNNSENNNSEEIIIQELNDKYFKIKDYLSKCGNNIYEIKKEELINILFSYFNISKYKKLNQ